MLFAFLYKFLDLATERFERMLVRSSRSRVIPDIAFGFYRPVGCSGIALPPKIVS